MSLLTPRPDPKKLTPNLNPATFDYERAKAKRRRVPPLMLDYVALHTRPEMFAGILPERLWPVAHAVLLNGEMRGDLFLHPQEDYLPAAVWTFDSDDPHNSAGTLLDLDQWAAAWAMQYRLTLQHEQSM